LELVVSTIRYERTV